MRGYPGDAACRLRTEIVNSKRKRFLTLDVEAYAYTFVSVVVRDQNRIPCCQISCGDRILNRRAFFSGNTLVFH